MKIQNEIRLTKEFDFETAHALFGYDGLCKNVHGHSYKLSVTVIGSPIINKKSKKNGMVIDFIDLKKIINDKIISLFDHGIVLNITTPHFEIANELEKRGHKIIRVKYQPTCELMILDFAKKISNFLPKNIKLFSLKLRETKTSYAEWYASDNH
ncbi:MAG: 6-carboxytetrahydropterin synthase [Flavobacteriaceae bacterium]|nr:6-carboxytetrahydropterin synthase [Flavobacteriaceae bacterium]